MDNNNKTLLAWFFRIVLAFTFCFSAYSKLIAPGLIEIIIVDHGFASARETAAIYVRLLIALEFAVGLLILQPNYLKKIILPGAILFLTVFCVYLVYSGFIIGDKQNCGCFGDVIKMSPLESIIKNIVFIFIALAAMFLLKEEKKKIVLPVLTFLVPFVFVFAVSPIKNVADLKFSNYTYFEDFGRVDLTQGTKLVAVMSLDCEHCQQAAKELHELKNNSDQFPEIFILFFSEGNTTVEKFRSITKSSFPYHMIKMREFFDLIGSAPPRIYWLEEGIVKDKWDEKFVERIKGTFLK